MRTASTSLVTRLRILPELHPVEEAHGLALGLGEDVGPQAVHDHLPYLERIALAEMEHHVGDDGQRREGNACRRGCRARLPSRSGPAISLELSTTSAGSCAPRTTVRAPIAQSFALIGLA
jgi:hypothetical protein